MGYQNTHKKKIILPLSYPLAVEREGLQVIYYEIGHTLIYYKSKILAKTWK